MGVTMKISALKTAERNKRNADVPRVRARREMCRTKDVNTKR
jgi:hypothetical protein